jgi:hypothetical protein
MPSDHARMPATASVEDGSFGAWDLDIPDQLKESVTRHGETLLRLLLSLRAIGTDEEKIEQALSAVIDSYKSELLATTRALREQNHR